jgi:hypothetical protein
VGHAEEHESKADGDTDRDIKRESGKECGGHGRILPHPFCCYNRRGFCMIKGERGDVMSERDWHRLREARLQAHYAAQWLGRLGSAFIPPQPDYSHTSMIWNDSLGGFTTNEMKDGTRFGLRIADLMFAFLNKAGEQIGSFPLNGRADQELRRWLDEQLNAAGMDARLLDKTSPYEIPAHAIARGAPYGVPEIADFLHELAGWFADAQFALDRVRQKMIGRSLAASPVRCWPHHFDLATLISLDAAGGENARSVNVGLSPGDEYYDEPYFYVSPYPYPDAAALPPLPKLGHWHTRDFTAAIAPASRIVKAKDKKAEIDDFLQVAASGAIKILSRE